jgi:hypothetical protein
MRELHAKRLEATPDQVGMILVVLGEEDVRWGMAHWHSG